MLLLNKEKIIQKCILKLMLLIIYTSLKRIPHAKVEA